MSTEDRRVDGLGSLLKRFPVLPMCGMGATVGVQELDDCAVIPLDESRELVVGSDFVRGEGFGLFKCGLLTRRQLGYYLVGANASDIAAMGAAPMGIVVAYRYSNATTDSQYAEVMEGVAEACSEFGMPLLGGDSGSYEVPVLSAAAFGVCPRGKALLRSGASPGDRLFLTGEVGLAGAAFQYFCSGLKRRQELSSAEIETLLFPWRRVQPALMQGMALVQHGLSRCAMDTSDGLLVSAKHIAQRSHVAVILEEGNIPIPVTVRRVAESLSLDPFRLTCGVSVDFRLCFTSPQSTQDELRRRFHDSGWPLYDVGFIEKCDAARVEILDRLGVRRVVTASDVVE